MASTHHVIMRKIIEVLEGFDGVARAKYLVAAGVPASQVRLAMSQGLLMRVSRGVYALPDASPVLTPIRSLPAEPTCVTAAIIQGLWVLHEPVKKHIAVTHSRKYPGYICHRLPGYPSVADIVVQSLRCLPDLDGLVIAESAVVTRGLQLGVLRQRLAGRNNERERLLVEQIVPQSQSIIECVARYHLRRAGFHVESQFNVPGMGHLDLMVDGRLGIETDGAGFHMDQASFEEDRRRWNVTTRLGVPTLVVSYRLLTERPQEFIAMVRDALARLNMAA